MAVIDRHTPAYVSRGTAFGRLWVLGLAGAAALAAEPLPGDLIASSGLSEGFVRAATFLNAALLLAALVGLGIIASVNVGLRSHLAPMVVPGSVHRREIFHWVQASLLVGVALIAARLIVDLWVSTQLPLSDAAFIKTAEAITAPTLTTSLLYHAVTEELMLRWGLMSGILWVMFLFFGKGTLRPQPKLVWAAILVSSLAVFMGQTPGLIMIGFGDTATLLLVYNGFVAAVTGIAFGWLFWKHGIEAAILAHIIMQLGIYGIERTPLI